MIQQTSRVAASIPRLSPPQQMRLELSSITPSTPLRLPHPPAPGDTWCTRSMAMLQLLLLLLPLLGMALQWCTLCTLLALLRLHPAGTSHTLSMPMPPLLQLPLALLQLPPALLLLLLPLL